MAEGSRLAIRETPATGDGTTAAALCRTTARLGKALSRGAYAHGYAEDYWTLDRIARLVWHMFAVRYHPSAVWHLLRRLGWSCQKPQRVSQDRDDKEVARSTRYQWARIKKVA